MTQFATNQAALQAHLKQNPFMPVFQLHTQGGKVKIIDDASNKVAQMYRAGVRNFEFLLRGDKTMELDEYTNQVLSAINELATKYSDAKFGVGTVSSKEQLEKIVANKDVSFIVTANWPGEEMVKMAVDSAKPIIPTVSRSDQLNFSEGGRIIQPGNEGTDELDPARIKTLQGLGVECAKIFDFGKIMTKRGAQKEDSPEKKAAYALVAIGEALYAAHGDGASIGREFFVMGTGGIDEKLLPYVIGGMKHDEVRECVEDILPQGRAGEEIWNIIRKTNVIAGGTFITKKFDEEFKHDQDNAVAERNLYKLALNSIESARAGLRGEVPPSIAMAAE